MQNIFSLQDVESGKYVDIMTQVRAAEKKAKAAALNATESDSRGHKVGFPGFHSNLNISKQKFTSVCWGHRKKIVGKKRLLEEREVVGRKDASPRPSPLKR